MIIWKWIENIPDSSSNIGNSTIDSVAASPKWQQSWRHSNKTIWLIYLFKTEEMDEGFSENTFCHCLSFSKLKRPLVHHNFLNLELGNKNK